MTGKTGYGSAIVLAALIVAGQCIASGEMAADELLTELKDGGYVIYLRHASTEKDYADQLTADPNSCATQRVLSENGWHQARSIGVGLAGAEVPIGTVTSSEYCRAWQTADLAFGTYSKSGALNFEKAENYTDEQFAAMRERVVPLISASPEQGKNNVIVGHDDPFEAATGIYPEPQGVAYVLAPKGNGEFEVIGSIHPDFWTGK